MIKAYRVVFKIGYWERWFDFETPVEACGFASIIASNEVLSESEEKKADVIIRLIKKEDGECDKEEDKEEDGECEEE